MPHLHPLLLNMALSLLQYYSGCPLHCLVNKMQSTECRLHPPRLKETAESKPRQPTQVVMVVFCCGPPFVASISEFPASLFIRFSLSLFAFPSLVSALVAYCSEVGNSLSAVYSEPSSHHEPLLTIPSFSVSMNSPSHYSVGFLLLVYRSSWFVPAAGLPKFRLSSQAALPSAAPAAWFTHTSRALYSVSLFLELILTVPFTEIAVDPISSTVLDRASALRDSFTPKYRTVSMYSVCYSPTSMDITYRYYLWCCFINGPGRCWQCISTQQVHSCR